MVAVMGDRAVGMTAFAVIPARASSSDHVRAIATRPAFAVA
jgi:hypothetical protein